MPNKALIEKLETVTNGQIPDSRLLVIGEQHQETSLLVLNVDAETDCTIGIADGRVTLEAHRDARLLMRFSVAGGKIKTAEKKVAAIRRAAEHAIKWLMQEQRYLQSTTKGVRMAA